MDLENVGSFQYLMYKIYIRVLRDKVFGTRPRIAPLSFAPTRTGPKNSKFYGPDPRPTRLYFPQTGPDRTGPKQLSINPKLTSFDPDQPESSEVWKLFCVEIKDLSFNSSFRLQKTREYVLQGSYNT